MAGERFSVLEDQNAECRANERAEVLPFECHSVPEK
jgi:hypothetical protein